jgi:Fe-S-cluster containining protein
MHPLPFLEQCAFLKEDQLCRIYATRPAVCRRFEAGSDQCKEARERFGIK